MERSRGSSDFDLACIKKAGQQPLMVKKQRKKKKKKIINQNFLLTIR
jgi:hypothetical protein